MTLIIDSSVIVKWFVEEDGHQEALGLFDLDRDLACPDFAFAETSNVLWRKVRMEEIEATHASSAIDALPSFFDRVVPGADLIKLGFELAGELDHSVYDCLFLAAAFSVEGGVLVSADEAFLRKCAAMGFGERIRPLRSTPLEIQFVAAQVEDILDLIDKHDRTIENICTSIRPSSERSPFLSFNPGDLTPAFDSPAYRDLTRRIAELNPTVAQTALAVSWYGRDRGSFGFEGDFHHAQEIASDPSAHIAYLASNLRYFERGIQRLRQTHPHLFESTTDGSNG